MYSVWLSNIFYFDIIMKIEIFYTQTYLIYLKGKKTVKKESKGIKG